MNGTQYHLGIQSHTRIDMFNNLAITNNIDAVTVAASQKLLIFRLKETQDLRHPQSVLFREGIYNLFIPNVVDSGHGSSGNGSVRHLNRHTESLRSSLLPFLHTAVSK